MKQHKFITIILEWVATIMIGAIGAILMIALVIGASIQESDKLHDMAAVVEVEK